MLDNDSIQRIGEALGYVGECLSELFVAIGEAIAEIADAISGVVETLPDVIEELQKAPRKTEPPRKPVRRVGCNPCTTVRKARVYRVQRR